MMTKNQIDIMDSWFNKQSRKCVFIDADDTLWHDSKYFRIIRSDFLRVCCSDKRDGINVINRLNENVKLCGLGEKQYAKAIEMTALSMGISDTNLQILHNAIEMFLSHGIESLPFAEEALAHMSNLNRILLTKGSENEQRSKLHRSKLSPYFNDIIIVERKDPKYFSELIKERALKANDIIVIGNSVRHDIIPAVSIGAAAIWLNHQENEHGRNEPLPTEACEVNDWAPIVNVLESRTS